MEPQLTGYVLLKHAIFLSYSLFFYVSNFFVYSFLDIVKITNNREHTLSFKSKLLWKNWVF